MRSAGIFLVGVLAGAGAVSLAAYVVQRSEPTQVAPARIADTPRMNPDPQKDDTHQASVQQEEKSEDNTVVHSSLAELGTPPVVFEPDSSAEWDALVGGMLEWEVEHRTGGQLSAEKRERLVSELARLREASLALQELPAEPGDSAELRERLTRTLTLVQVDATFRKELGLGVSEFLQELNPSAIEDVSTVPSAP